MLFSIALHAVCFVLFLHVVSTIITPKGSNRNVSPRMTISVEQRAIEKPKPLRHVRPVRAVAAASAQHELTKEVAHAPPQPPKRRPSVVSPLARDQAAFGREVARLNAEDDPHALPTIDPASQEAGIRSYRFAAPAGMRGESSGNGIITPTRSWQDRGRDCYYGRYEYTYPDGAEEDGSIVWPFCYDPLSDPFHEPPHPMPFPLPLAGYRLPSGTQLPPIERDVYQHWVAAVRR